MENVWKRQKLKPNPIVTHTQLSTSFHMCNFATNRTIHVDVYGKTSLIITISILQLIRKGIVIRCATVCVEFMFAKREHLA